MLGGNLLSGPNVGLWGVVEAQRVYMAWYRVYMGILSVQVPRPGFYKLNVSQTLLLDPSSHAQNLSRKPSWRLRGDLATTLQLAL